MESLVLKSKLPCAGAIGGKTVAAERVSTKTKTMVAKVFCEYLLEATQEIDPNDNDGRQYISALDLHTLRGVEEMNGNLLAFGSPSRLQK